MYEADRKMSNMVLEEVKFFLSTKFFELISDFPFSKKDYCFQFLIKEIKQNQIYELKVMPYSEEIFPHEQLESIKFLHNQVLG